MPLASAIAPLSAQLLYPTPAPETLQVPSMNQLYLMLIVTAMPGILGLLMNGIKWLANRTIQQEADDKKKVADRLDGTERRNGELDRSMMQMQSDLRTNAAELQSMRGTVHELKSTIDVRFDKQSEFYRNSLKEQTQTIGEKIDKLEQDLRQDMARAVADSVLRKKR